MIKFAPDGVLVIYLVSAIRPAFGGYGEMRYDAYLSEPDLDPNPDPDPKKRKKTKLWWRASVKNDGGTALIDARMEKMSKSILGRLHEDGFL